MNEKVSAYFEALRGKRIAVLGIGVSNRPLIRMLLRRGLTVLACDKTPRQQLDEEVLDLERMGATLHVGDGYLDGVQADIVFRTPGMHPDIPALRQLRESVCAAMEQRSGLDTAMQSAAQMVASRSGAELLQAACDLQTAIDSLDANASAGAVIGWLAMKLR